MTRFFAPVYMALHELGVGYQDARAMDISVAATYLGAREVPDDGRPAVAAAPTVIEPSVEYDPELTPNWVDEEGNPAPAVAPKGIRRPKWWKGDKAAFQSMTQAEVELAREHDRHTGKGG